jgi:hypothetical protein
MQSIFIIEFGIFNDDESQLIGFENNTFCFKFLSHFVTNGLISDSLQIGKLFSNDSFWFLIKEKNKRKIKKKLYFFFHL